MVALHAECLTTPFRLIQGNIQEADRGLDRYMCLGEAEVGRSSQSRRMESQILDRTRRGRGHEVWSLPAAIEKRPMLLEQKLNSKPCSTRIHLSLHRLPHNHSLTDKDVNADRARQQSCCAAGRMAATALRLRLLWHPHAYHMPCPAAGSSQDLPPCRTV